MRQYIETIRGSGLDLVFFEDAITSLVKVNMVLFDSHFFRIDFTVDLVFTMQEIACLILHSFESRCYSLKGFLHIKILGYYLLTSEKI